MGIKYEVRAKTGTYKDKDGAEKTAYTTMGKVIQMKEGGFVLKIDSVPVNWDGWAYLNPPREEATKPEKNDRRFDGAKSRQLDDDVPF